MHGQLYTPLVQLNHVPTQQMQAHNYIEIVINSNLHGHLDINQDIAQAQYLITPIT